MRPEPPFDLFSSHVLAAAIVRDLIAGNLPQREVARLGMSEVQATDTRPWPHRVRLSQFDAGRRLDLEYRPERPFFRVIRARGIPCCRPDAPIFLLYQLC